MDNSNYGQAPAQKRVERYDVISNINDMIETLRAASGVPFSSNCAVDRNEMIASLEELKNHLPASIAQSNDIVVRAQEIITTAREKSKKIIDDANRQYASKVNDHEITRGAREEAAQIIANAEAQAEELRRNAHIYVKSLLENVNETLSENIAKIQTNLTEINSTLDETE